MIDEEMIDKRIEELKKVKQTLEELQRELVKITRENEFFREKIDELKGERLKFYTDEIRQTQVINGVHFDTEQLLVFSEYVEQQKMVIAEKDKKIAVLEKAFELLAQDYISFTDEVEITGITEYFIKQAKKELGNEQKNL